MSYYIGRRAKVGLGRETERGVGVSPGLWVPLTGFTHEVKATKARSSAGYGQIASESQAIVTDKWAEGNLEMELNANAIGYILYALFGTVSTTGPFETDAYTHAFSIADSNQHTSLTIAVDEPNGDLTFPLAMVNSFEMTMERDALVKCTVGFQSKAPDDASQVATYAVDYKFAATDLSFQLAATTASLPATVIPLKSLSLSIQKNVIRDSVLGTVEPQDIFNQNLTISGKIELLYNDRTYRNYMLNGDYMAMRIALTNNRLLIGTATTIHPSLTFDFFKCDFEGWDVDRSLDSILQQAINFNVLYSVSDSSIISSCALINGKSSY